jgi:uroporphyrinogen-III synthase
VSGHGLAGIQVLVTRPAHQAERLCALIRDAGGEPVAFPVIVVEPTGTADEAARRIARLDAYDVALFVSTNAVEYGLALIETVWTTLPPGLRIGAVGKATAEALRGHGLDVDLLPAAGFNSEALLALDALQRVDGWRVLVFRGEGGRELLAEALRARGALVDYAEVYRRARPDMDPVPLLARWRAGGVDVVTITSAEALDNLHGLVGEAGRTLLLTTPLIVISERVAERAVALGFRHAPRVATEASDVGMVAALLAWARGATES